MVTSAVGNGAETVVSDLADFRGSTPPLLGNVSLATSSDCNTTRTV